MTSPTTTVVATTTAPRAAAAAVRLRAVAATAAATARLRATARLHVTAAAAVFPTTAAVAAAAAEGLSNVLPPPQVAHATGHPDPGRIARMLQLQHRVLPLLSFVLREGLRRLLLLLRVQKQLVDLAACSGLHAPI
jgi:hypothetical protein